MQSCQRCFHRFPAAGASETVCSTNKNRKTITNWLLVFNNCDLDDLRPRILSGRCIARFGHRQSRHALFPKFKRASLPEQNRPSRGRTLSGSSQSGGGGKKSLVG